jgi:hypothetical protein
MTRQCFTRRIGRAGVFSAVSAIVALCGSAMAQPHTSDIELALDGGRITPAAFGAGPGRVFVAEMGRSFANFTSDPGFDCQPGTFPFPSRNGFRVMDALREWNGSDFTEISSEALEISFSTLLAVTPPAAQTVEGFTLAVGSNGTWHRHLEYTLVDALGGPARRDRARSEQVELFFTRDETASRRGGWMYLMPKRRGVRSRGPQ